MRTTGKYILEHKVVTPCDDLMTWARWLQDRGDLRQIGYTQLTKDVRISTVFLGLDYSHGLGPPLFFETMIFGGLHDKYQRRYTTYEEAEDGHEQAVELAKASVYSEN